MTTSRSCRPSLRRRLFLSLLLLLLAAATLGAPVLAPALAPALALDVPPHGGQWVLDLAGLLPAGDKDSLTTSLRGYAQQSGNQIVVLTIPGLEGEDLSGYANRVAREWGVGRKDTNNGVLILVAAAERQVRFEVGRGIEDRLPDILCKRIQQEITVPHFTAGRFGPGLAASVAAIQQALNAAPGVAAAAFPQPADDGPPLWFVLPLGAMLLLLALEIFWRVYRSRHAAPAAASQGAASGALPVTFFGYLAGQLSRVFRDPVSRGRKGSGSGKDGGGGSGSGGSGGDGGGFSGGGGSSGGGGGGSSY